MGLVPGIKCGLLLGVASQLLRSVHWLMQPFHPFSLFLATSRRSSLASSLRVLGEVRQKRASQVEAWKAGEIRLSLCPLSLMVDKGSLFQCCAVLAWGRGDMHEVKLLFLPFHCIFSIVCVPLGCCDLSLDSTTLIKVFTDGCKLMFLLGRRTRSGTSCLPSCWCYSSDLSYSLTFSGFNPRCDNGLWFLCCICIW